MTILEMQEKKRELGYSNETLSRLSGVPLSTVQKILGGRTRAPRSVTIQALEAVLGGKAKGQPCGYQVPEEGSVLEEEKVPYGSTRGEGGPREGSLPLSWEAQAERMEGQVTLLEPPSRLHQEIVTEVLYALLTRIRKEEAALQRDYSSWSLYPAPFPVYLEGAEAGTFLEPDLTLLCSRNKLTETGCMGAPDWVMEVTSPQTLSRDYGGKLFLYRSCGVKEYWIVHPEKQIVTVYRFDREPEEVQVYSFGEEIPFSLLPGFCLKL